MVKNYIQSGDGAAMKKRRRSSRGLNKYIVFVLIVFLVIYMLTVFEVRVRPLIESMAESRAKSVAVRVISEVVNETMEKTQVTYSDLVIFQKNNEQNITAVTSNVVEINKLKSLLASEIEKRISDIEYMSTKIPLGNLLSQSLLSGMGPKINIKMVPVGFANIEMRNEFSSAGINQTKHEIYLEVKCSISVLLPMSSLAASVTTQIPVAETIIVGSVPDSYTHVSGQENVNDAVLNILE